MISLCRCPIPESLLCDMGMLQPFQDCGAIIREIAGRVKRILDMPAMFVWYFKEENTLRFWRLCGRIEKNTSKGNCRDPSTTPLCHGCCRHRHHQPCSAAVLYFSAQPDTNAIRELEQEVGLALSKTESSVVSQTLLEYLRSTRQQKDAPQIK